MFDAKAATWSEKYSPDGRLTGRLAMFLEALAINVPVGGRILDLGCGTGDLAHAADGAGFQVTACDVSLEMLRWAAARNPDSPIKWIPLDSQWQILPFASITFDAVVAASVLEYVDEPAAVLGECGRVLRPDGVVLCTVPDVTHPLRWLEGLAALALRLSSLEAEGRWWPLLDNYLTYLRISRQRHSVRWWRATAAQVGLRTAARMQSKAERSPLRLVTFHRTDACQRQMAEGEA
ncbi:MAG TPA: class I SAM-dependent methyltransferase [Streptosporangiaceae bacterium]|nr:class I SAM-dependent methyltransferase [Streptosporangiaceae bacterium]